MMTNERLETDKKRQVSSVQRCRKRSLSADSGKGDAG